jgi:hypothetical protein
MKGRRRHASRFFHYAVMPLLLLSAPTSWALAAEDLISVSADNKPLGAVLKEIEQQTGFRFILDQSWQDYPVTAELKEEPLDRGLKRLLKNLNCAVIFGSKGSIKILIYGEVSRAKADARHVPPVRVAPPVGQEPEPPPEPEAEAYEEEPPDEGEPPDERSQEEREGREDEAAEAGEQDTEQEKETEEPETGEEIDPMERRAS